MRVSLVLLAYALAVGAGAPWLLLRAAWVDRAPRLGVLAWQAATVGMVASVVLAGLAMAAPIPRISGDLARLLEACAMAMRAQYATPGGAAVSATGAVLALGIVGRVGYCIAITLRAARRDRREHLEALTLLGREQVGTDAVVVDHVQAAAYCLPGRRGRIVLTSAAIEELAADQMQAVLAHERAHLRARHDLAVNAAAALAHAFPKVRIMEVARSQIVRLAELAADDAACRRVGRVPLAEALLIVGGSPGPAHALGAGSSHTASRVRRLLAYPPPLGRARAGLTLTVAGFVLALPLAVAAEPAVAATQLDYCPSAADVTAAEPRY